MNPLFSILPEDFDELSKIFQELYGFYSQEQAG